MRTLITGGAGFIGSHLAERLIETGHSVLIVDNLRSGRIENLDGVFDLPQVKFVHADITEVPSIASHFDDIDWVFHLAGLADIVPSIEHPSTYYETNVSGTFNVLQCARDAGVQRFVYAASSSSYGIPDVYPTPESSPISPQYPYALTKHMGEELVLHWSQVYRMPAVSLRLFNVYGPRSRTSGAYGAVFGVFLAQKLNGQPFTVVGDGTQSRDFTHVSDVAKAFVATAESDVVGKAMNVGSGNHYSINRLVELLGGPVKHIPKRPGEPSCTFADTRLIRDLLDWQPCMTFEQGVADMLLNIGQWSDAPLWDSASISKATASWFSHLDRH